MRRSVLPLAASLTLLIVAAAGGQSAETGSIAGHVTLTSRVRGAALASTAYRPQALPTRREPDPAVSKIRDREGVLPHPFADERDDSGAGPSVLRTPGSDGTFGLANVPTGEYTVVGWATAGFRVSPDVTLRSSYTARKSFGASTWTDQVGVSIVWARRWW
jgi:hypothetical protein